MWSLRKWWLRAHTKNKKLPHSVISLLSFREIQLTDSYMSAPNTTWVTPWNFYVIVGLIKLDWQRLFHTIRNHVEIMAIAPPPPKKRICDCEYNIASENQEDVWREAHLAGDKWQHFVFLTRSPPSSNVQLHMEIGNRTLSHWQTITTMSLTAALGLKPLTKHNVAHHAKHQKKHRM